MNTSEIIIVDQGTLKLNLQETLNESFDVTDNDIDYHVASNSANIDIFLIKNEEAINFISYSFKFPKNGLTETASFEVRLVEKNINGEVVHTHKEMGINIERPVEDNTDN